MGGGGAEAAQGICGHSSVVTLALPSHVDQSVDSSRDFRSDFDQEFRGVPSLARLGLRRIEERSVVTGRLIAAAFDEQIDRGTCVPTQSFPSFFCLVVTAGAKDTRFLLQSGCQLDHAGCVGWIKLDDGGDNDCSL